MDKVEVKRIVAFLNDVHEGLCEGDGKATMRPIPGHPTEFFGVRHYVEL